MVMDVRDTYDVFGDNIDGHYGNQRKGDVLDDNATDILLIEASDFNDIIWISEEAALLSDNAYAVMESNFLFTQAFDLSWAASDEDTPVTVTLSVNSFGDLDTLVSTMNTAISGTQLTGKVEVIRRGNTIAFITRGFGRNASLSITNFGESTGDYGLEELGFSEGQLGVGQMVVDYGFDVDGDYEDTSPGEATLHRVLLGTWRADDGTPMVEQFRISGLGGNDRLGFVEGANALDATALNERSKDWVGVLDGGPGDDILSGSGARDRIDGGFGSDTIYGYGGDDSLWGDGGPGQGLPDDVDRIYAGQGNDDVLGGQGRNYLYAWSKDPNIGGINDTAVTELNFEDGMYVAVTDFTAGQDVARILGIGDAPVTGQLTSDAHFTVIIGEGTQPIDVVVSQYATSDNLTISHLVEDINEAFAAATYPDGTVAHLDMLLEAGRDGNKITLTTTGTLLTVGSGAGDATRTELHFGEGASDVPLSSAGYETVTALAAAPSNGQITGDAHFTIQFNNEGLEYPIVLAAADTADNQSVADLVADLNAALAAEGLSDKVIAGSENGVLTLSSRITSVKLISQFGVYVDSETGVLYDNDGGGIYQIEDTGLNRILGGPMDDDLYGGTGLDFLYGREGDNQLWRSDGTPFESLDGGLSGDAWKEYAKESDKVWYYRGTNADDVISVDFVTEPGLLAGKHLITRLTNNNGNYTFDAQVKLSFDATDASGNLIWNASDSQIELDAFKREGEEGTDQAKADYREDQLIGGLLPPEDDYLVIIIDAMNGDDVVSIGPTVQKTVWVDGGYGDDRIEIASGNAILPDKTEGSTRNDIPEVAYSLGKAWLVAVHFPSDENFRLSALDGSTGPTISLFVNGSDEAVVLTVSGTENNQNISDLVADINSALVSEGLDENLVALSIGGRMAIGPTASSNVVSLEIGGYEGNSLTVEEIGFVDKSVIGQAVITAQDQAAEIVAPNQPTLTASGVFTVTVNGTAYTVTLVDQGDANTTIGLLLEDLNAALAGAAPGSLGGVLAAENRNGRIAIVPVDAESVQDVALDGSAVVEALGFTAGQSGEFVSGDAPADGRLSADSNFALSINGAPYSAVTVLKAATDDNTSIDDLVADINAALTEAGIDHLVRASRIGDRIRFVTVIGGSRASINLDAGAGDPIISELHFRDDQTAVASLLISQNTTLTGLTMDNADDVDWYSFTLAEAPGADAMIRLNSASELDGLGLAIFPADGANQIDLDAEPSSINPDSIDLDGSNDTVGDAYVINNVNDLSKIFGLTIGTAQDEDWFSFTLDHDGTDADRFSILRTDGAGTVVFEILDGDGNLIVDGNGDFLEKDDSSYRFIGDTSGQEYIKFSLGGLAEGDYTLRVTADGPACYELYPSIGDPGYTLKDLSGKSESGISLAGLEAGSTYLLRVTTPNLVPTIYDLSFVLDTTAGAEAVVQDMATRQDQVRKDVLMGGPGNDVLMGGMGEDWIFGGPGNDVLCGGYDRQAPDLLFGEDGNDTFQLMPDELPLLEGSDQTYVPTFVDTFYGGDGTDRVLFLGGDTDNLGREVPDFVAIRYNRILHRYEFTALVWDTANQEFVTEEVPGAIVKAQGVSSYDGRLAGDVEFDILLSETRYTVIVEKAQGDGVIVADSAPSLSSNDAQEIFSVVIGDFAPVEVTVSTGSSTIGELVDAVNDGIRSTTLTGKVVVEQTNVGGVDMLVLKPAGILDGDHIEIQAPEGETDLSYFGFTDGQRAELNNSVRDLAEDIEAAMRKATDEDGTTVDVTDRIIAGAEGGRLLFQTTALSKADDLRVEGAGAVALGFTNPQDQEPETVIYTQTYVFYQAHQVEETVIDVRGGDDVVHADPEYKFPNVDSEWGIDPGDEEQGGDISALIIYGGEGDDILYGGAYDDEIYGGSGIDFIAGGGGGDYIDGGPGGDLLAGDTTTAPDDYELVDRIGQTSSNNEPAFASELPEIGPGTEIDGLTLHEGDPCDWYLIKTPDAVKNFGAASAAQLMMDMIEVVFDQPDMQALFDGFAGTNSYLYAARNVGTEEALEIVPVEKYSGVPAYYVLKIENVQSFSVTAIDPVVTLGRLSADAVVGISIDGADPVSVTVYSSARTVEGTVFDGTANNVDIDDLIADLNESLAATDLSGIVRAEKASIATGFRVSLTGAYAMTIEVSYAAGDAASELGFEDGQSNVGRAPSMGRYKLVFSESVLGTAVDVGGDDADVQVSVTDPSYRPAVIPLGDINGDGFADYIAAVKDNLTGTGSSYARVILGSGAGEDFDLETAPGFTLKLPAPVLYPTSTTQAQTFFAEPGNYGGDGTDDILLTVTTPTGTAVAGLEQAVYVIFGSSTATWADEYDVYGQADVRIVGTAGGGDILATSAGNLDGDGYDDFVVSQGNNAYLFYGKDKDSWGTGRLLDEDFEGDPVAFQFTLDDGGDTTLWHLTTRRSGDSNHSATHSIYYGLDDTGTYNLLDTDTGLPIQTFGTVTSSVVVDLSGYTTATLSFKYYLQTEGRPSSYDQVQVIVIDMADLSEHPVASNATGSGAVLTDPSSGWKSASVDLSDFAGKTIKIRFAFDSVDDVENQYEGWYVDDVRIVAPKSVGDADATFTVAGLVSAAGIGNYDGSGPDDLAFLNGAGTVFIYYGVQDVEFTDTTVLASNDDLTLTTGIAGVLTGVGDVNGDDKGDFVVNGGTQALLVLGGSAAPDAALQVVAMRVYGRIGDVNGDGIDDLGALALESSPDLAQNGDFVTHAVGQVFLGSGVWTAGSFETPALVFELDNPSYQDSGAGTIPRQYFAGLGNVNGDTVDHDGDAGTPEIAVYDLAVAETLGTRVHLSFGKALSAYTAPEASESDKPLRKIFVYELATPNMTGSDSTAHTGIDPSDTVTDFNMHDSFALEGSAIGQELSAAQVIGDFDGDGNDDFLVSGPVYSYIFLGPMDVTGLSDVSVAADFIIDAASLGRPADRMGDVDADGKTDLAFVLHDDGGEKTVVTVILGGRVMPRIIDAASLEELYTRRVELEDTLLNGDGEVTVMIGNWSGHVDAQTGRPYYDLVVVSSLPGETNSYGYVFAGDTIKARTTPMGSGDALVDLKLFTTTVDVATARVPVRSPDLDTVESTEKVTISPVHSEDGTAGGITDATQAMTYMYVVAGNTISVDPVSSSTTVGTLRLVASATPSGTGAFDSGSGIITVEINSNGTTTTAQVAAAIQAAGGGGVFTATSSGAAAVPSAAAGDYEAGFSVTHAVGDGLNAYYYDGMGAGNATTVTSSTSANYYIYDHTRTVSSLNLNAPGATGNVHVHFEIIHTYIGDLVIWIVDPDGTSYLVHNRSGGSTDNMVRDYYFDSAAITENGTWQLIVDDNAGADQGYIDYWYVQCTSDPSPRWTGTDATVNFEWGSGVQYNSQYNSGDSDTFSERWTGYVSPKATGDYQFATVSDDGARLWVDGIGWVIDAWYDQGPTWHYSGSINLTAGTYTYIEMQHYENGGGATAKLYWNGPGTNGWEIVPQQNLFTTNTPAADASPRYITDGGEISSSVTVSGATKDIKTVSVTIDELRHTYIGDLVITLTEPTGGIFTLWNRGGGTTDDFVDYVFDSGNVGSLAQLEGYSANGTWTLTVKDLAGGDQGRLVKWSIDIVTAVDVPETTEYTATVSDVQGLITDVNVRVDISHDRVSDLTLKLLSPNGSVIPVTLVERQGGTGSDFSNTVFDVGGLGSITGGSAPFSGSFVPEGDLNSFNGEDPNGDWTLIVIDSVYGTSGVVNGWSVDIRTNEIVTSEIAVAGLVRDNDDVELTDLNLWLNIAHSSSDDLDVWLVSPGGTRVEIATSGRGVAGSLFDDEGTVADSVLHDFFGHSDSGGNLNGVWTLEIRDNTGDVAGTLNGWSMYLGTTPTVSQIEVEDLPDGLWDLDVTVRLGDDPDDLYDLDLSDYSLEVRKLDSAGTVVNSVTLFGSGLLTGGSLGNVVLGTTFDDEASIGIGAGQAPYTSSYSPEELLSGFDGIDPNGTWELVLTDHTGETVGRIEDWSLTFSFKPEDAESMTVAVGGDISGDGLEDLLIGVTGFDTAPNDPPDPRVGWAYVLGGRLSPVNSGLGTVTNGYELADGEVIATAWTVLGSPVMNARAVFELGGENNNLWFEALDAGTGTNGILIKLVMDTDLDVDPAKATYAGGILTITVRDSAVTANDVINAVENDALAAGFRADFRVALTAESVVNVPDHAGFRVYDTSLGAGVYALGDLNRDGYDDFAVSRTREDAGTALGGLLVFYGNGSYGDGPVDALDASDWASVTIQQATAEELGATSLVSSLQATAGDINGDGVLDLIVGQPEVIRISSVSDEYLVNEILSRDERGSVYVFKSFSTLEQTLTLAQADLILDGEGEYDHFGHLPVTPCMDLDGDRIDDLLLGAPNVDGTLGSAKQDSGQIYVVYGNYRTVVMPTTGYAILTNRTITGSGSFLVDTGIGRPDEFYDPDLDNNGVLDSTRYTLLPGEGQKWYRFTTLGDGELGTMIRLTPAASAGMTTRLSGHDGVISGGLVDPDATPGTNDEFLVGPADGTDVTSFILELVAGGTRGSEVATYAAGTLSVVIEDGVSTAADIIAAINAMTGSGGSFRAVLAGTDNTGQGTVAAGGTYDVALTVVLAGDGLELATGTAAIVEFDLSAYLAYMDDPEVLERVALLLSGLSGEAVTLPSPAANLTVVGGDSLYFTAVDALGSNQLWVSDGTAGGTRHVADLPGTPDRLVDGGGVLHFTLTGGQSNASAGITEPDQLWKVQAGSPAIVFVDQFDSTPVDVVAAGGKVFVKVDGGIRVDGAPVKYSGSAVDNVTEMVEVNEIVYFVADHLGEYTLFSTSGNTAALVAETAALYGTSDPFVFVGETAEIGEFVYFTAMHENERVLWFTQGGSAQVARDANGRVLKNPDHFTVYSGSLYFAADNGVSGMELWKTTDGVTFTVIDIKTGGGSNPNNLFVTSGDVMYLCATKSAGAELFKSTDGETFTQVANINGSGDSSPKNFVEYDGGVYFSADDGTNGFELWTTDGTEAGTELVKNINTTAGKSSSPREFVVHDGLLYFTAQDATHGRELWVTDGTTGGTELFKDIFQGSIGSGVGSLTVFDNGTAGDTTDDILYFTANDGVNGMEVWMIGTGQATATIEPPGTNNDILVTSTGLEGGVTIRVIHDTDVASDDFPDVTSNGDETHGATGSFTLPDSLSAITVTAASFGAEYNGVDVRILKTGTSGSAVYDSTVNIITVTVNRDGTTTSADVKNLIDGLAEFTATGGDGTVIPCDLAEATWEPATSTLTIGINGGITTAATVIAAIDAGTAQHGLGAESAGTDGGDSGVINTATVVTGGGDDAQPVTYTLTLGGADNDVLVKGELGVTYTNLTVNIVDDDAHVYGSWEQYHADAAYDDGNEILTVYIKSGVTTREDILKAIGTSDYHNEVVPFTAEAAAGEKTYDEGELVHGTVGITQLTGGGQAGDAALVVVDPYGDSNAILFKAISGGSAGNGMRVAYVDDGSVSGNSAVPSWDDANKILTVTIDSGVTTAATIVSQVNTGGYIGNDMDTFRASFVAVGYGSGTVSTTITPSFTDGGDGNSRATVSINPDGTQNTIVYTARADGSQFNGVGIVYVDDGSVSGDNATPYWNAGARLLIVKIDSGSTKASTIVSQVNNYNGNDMDLFQGDFTASTPSGGGTVPAHGSVALTAGGDAGTNASVIVTFAGDQNDILLVAKSTGATYNGTGIMFIDDGTLSGDDATPVWDANAKMLIVKIHSGTTTAHTVLDRVTTYESTDMTAFRAAYGVAAVSTGTVTVPAAVTSGGDDGTAASGAFNVVGDVITLTASDVGAEFNGVTVELVAGAVEGAVYASGTITVTVLSNGGTSTARVVELINGITDGPFVASGGTAKKVFLANFANVTQTTGVDGVAAGATFTLGTDDIVVTATAEGAEWTVSTLLLTTGGALGTPSFDAGTDTISLQITATTTTAEVASAIDGMDEFDTASVGSATVAVAGTIDGTDLTAGVTEELATGSFTIQGSSTAITITATAPGTAFNGVGVVLVADVDAGSESASYGLLTITVHVAGDGSTTASEIAGLINGVGVSEFGATGGDATKVFIDTYAGATGTNGADAVPSAANLYVNPADAGEVITVTATTPGVAGDGLKIAVIDDGTDGSGGTLSPGGAAAILSGTMLTVYIDSGATTMSTVVSAIDGAAGPDYDAATDPANDDVVITVPTGVTADGSGSAPASVILEPDGDDNDIEIAAKTDGIAYNDVNVVIRDDGSITDGSASAAYDSAAHLLTILIEDGVTTAHSVITAVNGIAAPNDTFTASVTGDSTDSDGGVISLHTLAKESDGTSGDTATATVSPTGDGNDIVFTATRAGADLNGVEIRFEDGAAEGFETAVFNSVGEDKFLVIRIKAGKSTASAVVSAVNGIANFEFSAELADGNDGSGVIDTFAVVTEGSFYQLDDINSSGGAEPEELIVYGGYVYFAATDGIDGTELWRVDPASGTAGRVTDINASGDSNPSGLTVFTDSDDNAWLYFIAGDGSSVKLWRTNGTTTEEVTRGASSFVTPSAPAAGSDMLAVVSREGFNTFLTVVMSWGTTQDVGQQVAVTDASNLADWNDVLAFVVDRGETYEVRTATGELYSAGQAVGNLTGVGGDLFFTVGGKSLYVYSGGSATLVRDHSYQLAQLTAVGATLFYVEDTGANDVLFKYRRTGTDPDAAPVSLKRLSGSAYSMTDVNGTLFFALGSDRGTSLWQSGGTALTTVQVRYQEDAEWITVADPSDMVVLSNQLYFTSPNADGPASLWKSEKEVIWTTGRLETFGGVSLPVITVEVLAGEGDGVITASDFTARALAAYTTELNRDSLDLTAVVRELLAEGNTWLTVRLQSDSPITLQRARAADDTATGLVVETAERTGVVADLYTADGHLLVEGKSIVDLSLFPAGTYFLKVYDPSSTIDTEKVENDQGNQITNPTELTAVGDMVYFVIVEEGQGQLWRSNGGSTAQVKVSGLPNTTVHSTPTNLIGVGETLYFTLGTELWKTEGVFAEKVGDLAGAAPAHMTAVEDGLFFFIGTILHVSDGAGVDEVEDLSVTVPGLVEADITDAVASGQALCFQVEGALWRSDGTAAGTCAVSSVDPGVVDSQDVVAMNGYVYYLVHEDTTVTLWKADPAQGELVGAEPLDVDALASVEASGGDLLGVLDDYLLFTVTTTAGGRATVGE